ncbi:RNA-binding protein [Haloterrigena sp. SYSU A558-1]|uniref:RNA-binding protein n=1 Tax=Haloterrigena gelatinilytica TaxID=2741724 RepID=A0A8J8GIX6_9EURY|nr:RNA-binding protein [Haloterrigena gelatinilytica]NUB90848.1 RNA-binding protein [Haloterrigena gelatinilytica]NUC73334.1 RNA-binding protein [Haloterrigena gelatinilytica]
MFGAASSVGVFALVAGAFVVLVVGSWLRKRVRGGRSAERRQSYERHKAAQEREPPVDLGDVREAAVHEFTEHHTGERRAVCKIEGFVVFVEEVPGDLSVGDVIELEVLSFNRGHTSATARFRRIA